MKKKIVIFLGIPFLCFILQGCTGNFYLKAVAAKDAKITADIKIAVVPENWYWLGVSNFLPRALITEFMDLGFTVVERSQLEKIFEELKIDVSGAVKDTEKKREEQGLDLGVLDKTSIRKIGELLGVNAILLSYIVPSSSDEVSKATFRLVDVETAQVLFSITFINGVHGDMRKLKTGDSIPTKQLIEAIKLSVAQLLKGEKRVAGGMGTLNIIVKPIEK